LIEIKVQYYLLSCFAIIYFLRDESPTVQIQVQYIFIYFSATNPIAYNYCRTLPY